MISRRTLLRGITSTAGAALLAPALRQAWASGPVPRRFVFVLEGNSTEPVTMMSNATRLAIDGSATDATAGLRSFASKYGHTSPLVIQAGDLATAPALGALAASSGSVDLTAHASVTLGLSSKITGGGHTTNHGALSSTRSTATYPGGVTIDAVLAALPDIRRTAALDAVRVGIHSRDTNLSNTTCAYGVGRPAPIIMDPGQAYAYLFGSVAGPAGQAAFTRQGSLLDYASSDVQAALSSFGGSSQERAKLERYLASIEDLIHEHQILAGMQSQLAAVAPPGPDTNPMYSAVAPLDRLQVQFDLVASALLGNLTNVAVIASGTGYAFDFAYPSLIDDLTRHDLHHGAATNPDYVTAIHSASRRHVDMIAKLARTLASQPEDGGTMLDNTVIMFLPDNGERHHSAAEEFPILMVGGQNLGMLNDGRTTVFPGYRQDTNRQLSNLFNTLSYAAGAPVDDFGQEGPQRIAFGPLSELRS